MDQSDITKEAASLAERSKMKTLLPFCIFIFLVGAILVIPLTVIPHWYHMIKVLEDKVDLESRIAHSQLMSEIENTAKVMLPINSSAVKLARVLTSTLQGHEFSFSLIETQVAPALFQALSTIPYLLQASYIGLDGLFFSYYSEGNKTLAVYSNTTFSTYSSFGEHNYTWYTQPAYSDTGNLYGDIMITKPLNAKNASWFEESMNSTNGYASLGIQWKSGKENLFLNTARVGGIKGAISLGIPVKALTDFFSHIDFHGASLYLATNDGKVLVQNMANATITYYHNNSTASVTVDLEGTQNVHAGNVPCNANNHKLDGTSVLNIGGTEFMFYCSPINVVGVESVYILAFPNKELENVHERSKTALVLLIVMLVATVLALIAFVCIVGIAKWREMRICSVLIKQMDATQQAERKSMNKSLAYASATHDVRAALGGIISLIEADYKEVTPGSELDKNLKLAASCAKDLLELMNSVLDMSKIEAGRMQLTEVEFSLTELLEDVADLFHPLGMKKGVEVVLDFCDGSVYKNQLVKGDRGKLKQILSNLLSNAVKFTMDGHVSLRAWAQRPSIENSIMASNQKISSFMSWISCLFSKEEEVEDMNEIQKIKQDPRCMEIIIEVDDTGKGIPKEKRKSVFENYVQVKETAAGTGGTGLGLGIVQSLVRLMGGEIEILDKEHCERGTCFRFNVFFIVCENDGSLSTDASKRVHVDSEDHSILGDLYPSSGCSTFAPSPKAESSLVVMLIQNNERCRMVQECMHNLGVQAVIIKKGSKFCCVLRKIKNRLVNPCQVSSSGLSDLSPRSWLSSGGSSVGMVANKNLPLSMMDGLEDDALPAAHVRRTNMKGPISCVLIVIDTSAGDFSELCKSVAEFRKDLHSSTTTCCNVVWLDKPETRKLHFWGLGQENLAPTDLVITKPLHGSRLFQIIGLLPEFGGKRAGRASTRRNGDNTPGSAADLPSELNKIDAAAASRDSPATACSRWHGEIEELSSSSSDMPLKRRTSIPRRNAFRQDEAPEFGRSSSEKYAGSRKLEAMESKIGESRTNQKSTTIQKGKAKELGSSSSGKILDGRRILIVDDNHMLGMVSEAFVSRLGASVLLSHSGEEAVTLVSKGLQEQTISGAPEIPFDYILMDCEMPGMDGFEATEMIRKEEEKYGVHIPIIALTAHTADEKGTRIKEAGMDFHLTKPLQQSQLVDYIRENEKL